MRKVLLFLFPVVVAIGLFAAYIIFFAKDTGKGALQVTSVPASRVYLNGKLLGTTPVCKCDGNSTLPVGSYTIRLIPTNPSLSQEVFEQPISITKSTLTVVDRTFGVGPTSEGSVINLLPIPSKTTASIFIASLPTGVSVSLDGNTSGMTPLTIAKTTDSDHDILLSKSGYKTKELRIHTVNGYQLSLTASLAVDTDAMTATSAATQTASASAAIPTVQKIVILDTPTGFLRVRSDPNFSGQEVAEVNPGQTFDLLSEQDGWYQIKLTDGKTGWISSSYAQKQ